MKLTKSTDYALRLLIYLAEQSHLVTMKALSVQLHIPYDNLTKIVQKLAKYQFVYTEQGKYGGVMMNKCASMISLQDIIALIDGPTQLSECQQNPQSCGLSCTCQLKHVFGNLEYKINQLFNQITIKDVMTHECTKTV